MKDQASSNGELQSQLAQREAELAIINSVQEGLASKLDYNAIIQLVGGKVMEIFQADTTYIALFDEHQEHFHFPFYVDRGATLQNVNGTLPLGPGLTSTVFNSRNPLLLGTIEAQREAGGISPAYRTLTEDRNETYLGVPILLGDTVLGVLSVQRYQQHAYDERQVTLLQTLANSMSVALENARLFDETQRLLKETEQRSAELAVINSVQRALAAKLDITGIYDAVGDKIVEIFPKADVGIRIHDAATDLVHFPYTTEHGRRIRVDPIPMGAGITQHVFGTRQPLLINENLEEVIRKLGSVLLQGTQMAKSAVYVPILSGRQARGVVQLEDMNREHAFSSSDVRLLTTVADAMSVALENARLFDETQRLLRETEQRATELAIINSVQEGLASKLDMQAIYDLVGEKIRAIFDAEAVTINTYDLLARRKLYHYNYEGGQRFPFASAPMNTFDEFFIDSGMPYLLNEGLAEVTRGRFPDVVPIQGELPKSFLCSPLLREKRVFGYISLQNMDRENAFSESDVRLLQTLTNTMSVALENARLFDETQRLLRETEQRAAELGAISAVSQALVAEADLNRVIQLIGEQLVAIFKPDIAYVALLDVPARTIEFPYKYGDEFPPLKLGEGLSSKIIQSAQPLLINRDIAKRAAEMGTERVGKLAASFLGVPILAGKESIGVISVQSTREEDVFNEDDLRLLSTIAANAGAAIQTARLHAETQHRAREMAALAEVGREISSTLDRAVVLERIARHAEQLLAAQSSAVFLLEPDHRSMRAIAAVGQMAKELKGDRIVLGRGVIGVLAQEARAEFVNDMTLDPRAEPIPGTENIHFERLMAAPLLKGDDVVGMLAVWRAAEPFREADLNFLVGLARQAAIALENARLFAEIEAEKRFSETLVQNSPVAIMSIDDQSRVVAWNPGAEKLFGYTAEEAVGCNIDDLIANSDEIRAEATAYTEQASRAEFIHAITKRTRKDGSFVDVEISGVPVRGEGRHFGFIGIYHDITELQRARKEAVSANEAKSAFLATMSHEIRTPMNAVIGMSGLLMDTRLSAEQREFAETIRNSGNTLLGIINDILDFSKIEAGKMELEHQPFDLRECVESALDLVAGRAVEKNLDLAYVIDDDVPAGIQGDVTRLRQILLNLMSNALKFTDRGEVVLTVKRDRRPDHLIFAVRDSGIGIPADRMSRLFESFSQADSSTTRRFGGTGLGLAISKRLAELMDGAMWAESPGPGLGSTFSFTVAFQAAPPPQTTAARDLTGVQPLLKGKQALIVDDNATNRRILSLQAQKWGMQTREAETAVEALEWLNSAEHFDLAILDMQMPEMDGFTLTRELRKIRHRQRLPVILLTSLGRREAAVTTLNFAAYLTKPLKPSALFDALSDVFAGAEATGKIQPARAPAGAIMSARHPLRILLAEDNAVNQKLALRLLEQMGYRADVASNGVEAVESVQRQEYDVILMDVQMPEMDGLDATRTIRGLDTIRQPRIVAMTANAMSGDREMCLEAGMDDYLSKPIRVQELSASLRVAARPQPVDLLSTGRRREGASGRKLPSSGDSAKSRRPQARPAKSVRKARRK